MESPYSGQLRRGFQDEAFQAASGARAPASPPRREHTCRSVDCHRHGRRGDPGGRWDDGGGGDSTSDLWQEISASAARSGDAELSVDPERFSSYSLDHDGLAAALEAAPREFTQAAREEPLVLALPAPRGDFQRFAVVESPIMEPELAAKHPDIKTYRGRGLDDKTRHGPRRPDAARLPRLGALARGSWYVEPNVHLETSCT